MSTGRLTTTTTDNGPDTDEISIGRREGNAFDLVLRGYDRDQVEERLAQWADALVQAEQQRDEALIALAEAEASPPRPAIELSDRLQRILVMAEDEADEIRTNADERVRTAVNQAEAEAAAVREAADHDVRRELASARAEATRIVNEALNEARRTLEHASAEAADVALNTAKQRQEAMEAHEALLAEQQSEHRRETDRLLEEITHLEASRDEVREQVTRLRDALAASVGVFGDGKAS